MSWEGHELPEFREGLQIVDEVWVAGHHWTIVFIDRQEVLVERPVDWAVGADAVANHIGTALRHKPKVCGMDLVAASAARDPHARKRAGVAIGATDVHSKACFAERDVTEDQIDAMLWRTRHDLRSALLPTSDGVASYDDARSWLPYL